MNEEISDAIAESVHDVFHGFLAMEVFPGDRDSASGMARNQETATVVGFTGALRGSVILGASVPTALNLAGTLAGTRFPSLEGSAMDMLGELTDLIAGGMRTRLSCHGDIRLTPPIVVIGGGFTLNNTSIFSCVRQNFQVIGGRFFVDCFYLKDLS